MIDTPVTEPVVVDAPPDWADHPARDAQAGDTVPVYIKRQVIGGYVEVQGQVVTPGLAVTPTIRDATGAPSTRHFSLTHIRSGLNLGVSGRCRTHVDEIAAAVAAVGIDWTADHKTALANQEQVRQVTDILKASGRCVRACFMQPGERDVEASCETCDAYMEPDDELDDGPLTVADAKRWAEDHECEPQIVFKVPGSDAHLTPDDFDKNGQPRPVWSTALQVLHGEGDTATWTVPRDASIWSERPWPPDSTDLAGYAESHYGKQMDAVEARAALRAGATPPATAVPSARDTHLPRRMAAWRRLPTDPRIRHGADNREPDAVYEPAAETEA